MRFINDRPYSDPEKAARKIVEIANADRRSPLGFARDIDLRKRHGRLRPQQLLHRLAATVMTRNVEVRLRLALSDRCASSSQRAPSPAAAVAASES